MINSVCRIFLVSFKEKTPSTLHLPEICESLQEGTVCKPLHAKQGLNADTNSASSDQPGH